MSTQPDLPGLDLSPSSRPQSYRDDIKPIDRCGSDQAFHDNLLRYFLTRLETSERKMAQFYPRWRANELKLQAYIDLPDYERLLEQMNKDKKPPSPVSITFPYAFANAWTVTTYHMHTFFGRKPHFQVGAWKAESVQGSMNMERLLQWNSDQTRMIRRGFQHFMDGQVYGVAAFRTLWKTRYAMRSKIVKPNAFQGLLQSVMGAGAVARERVRKLIFEGNEVECVDPFMFFPDPNVPMAEVNKKGEYVFWREYVGKHLLLAAEADGSVKHVGKAKAQAPGNKNFSNESARGRFVLGDSQAGMTRDNQSGAQPYQLDQGSVLLCPKELGLGPSMQLERWIVSIANKSQIIQIEPLDVEFDMHPVAVSEPLTMGYGFGQPGLVDYVGSVQDTLSWLLNSHIHNVRGALNNSFIVDPSMVEMSDLTNPAPGKVIRLKRSAIGQDVRAALQQIPVQDVTRAHMSDLPIFQRVADTISGVSDNIRGLQDQGGRKTATEVRTSSEAGASRLAAQAKLISSQSFVDLTEQMSVNLQAKMTQEVYVSVLGRAGMDAPMTIGPEAIIGDYTYPVNDGTLPMDKVALLDIWREILMGVAQQPLLSSKYDISKIFEFVAKLGGAENIESFKVNVAPEPGPGQVPVGSLQ